MLKSGVARLWEVARFNLIARCGVPLPRNLIKTCMCVCVCVRWNVSVTLCSRVLSHHVVSLTRRL